ncbi:hypothetical protein V8G54_017969 [Vigna mungo]|uniref:Uncharacterized protein n=1 Tax=Vigna mungo TaxID=3915 RepID=A0AAQ3RTI4_VIGMU
MQHTGNWKLGSWWDLVQLSATHFVVEIGDQGDHGLPYRAGLDNFITIVGFKICQANRMHHLDSLDFVVQHQGRWINLIRELADFKFWFLWNFCRSRSRSRSPLPPSDLSGFSLLAMYNGELAWLRRIFFITAGVGIRNKSPKRRSASRSPSRSRSRSKSLSRSVSWNSDSSLDDFVFGLFNWVSLNYISPDLIELGLAGELIVAIDEVADVVSATTKFSSKIDISHEKHLFGFMFDIGLEIVPIGDLVLNTEDLSDLRFL